MLALSPFCRQPRRADAQAELDHRVVAVALGLRLDQAHAVGDVEPEGLGIARQRLAQHDQRARRRVVEHALGQQEGLGRAAALLAQRIGGEQHHRTLRPAHGWLVRSRTKVSATFLLLPGDRQVDAEHLGLLVVAQHVGAQHAAVQADLQLHAGHAEIVAGDVLDLGRPLVDADRLGELDGRRQVGNDMQLPARLLVAARLQGDLACPR